MKLLTLIVILFAAFPVLATTDSMLVAHRNNQTTIVINEMATETKLKSLIDIAGSNGQLNLISKNGDVSVSCKTGAGAASCTFKLVKSPEVEWDKKTAFLYSDSDNTSTFRVAQPYSETFENKSGDKFNLFFGFFEIVAEVVKK